MPQSSPPPAPAPVPNAERPRTFRSFAEFYPFYLGEHANRTSRRFHFIGTSIAAALLVTALLTRSAWFVLVAVFAGYLLAFAGHFLFEHNRPATFKFPWLSFCADWRLWWDILTGRMPF